MLYLRVASIPLAAMTSTASIVYDQLIEGAVRLGGRLVTGHNWRISVSVLNKQHGGMDDIITISIMMQSVRLYRDLI